MSEAFCGCKHRQLLEDGTSRGLPAREAPRRHLGVATKLSDRTSSPLSAAHAILKPRDARQLGHPAPVAAYPEGTQLSTLMPNSVTIFGMGWFSSEARSKRMAARRNSGGEDSGPRHFLSFAYTVRVTSPPVHRTVANLPC
jgi:hypothetical protein